MNSDTINVLTSPWQNIKGYLRADFSAMNLIEGAFVNIQIIFKLEKYLNLKLSERCLPYCYKNWLNMLFRDKTLRISFYYRPYL